LRLRNSTQKQKAAETAHTRNMASWDDEDFEEQLDKKIITPGTDKWEGEDEDSDGLKDNWDDEDEEEDDKPKPQVEVKQKKKKTLQEKIKEREEKKRLEALEREEERKRIEEENKELSPEEALAAKIEAQRLQEESDLQLAREAFGVTDQPPPGTKTIDNFVPTSKEDFDELRSMLVKKLSAHESKKDYPLFLENMFRELCTGIEPDDIKKISSALTSLATEKQKAVKAAKGGTKKKGKTLKVGKASKNDDFDNYDNAYDDYDDFM